MTFDEVQRLIQTFDESSLTELQYAQGDDTLTLKKRSSDNPVYTQPIVVHPQSVMAAGGIAGTVAPEGAVTSSGSTAPPPPSETESSHRGDADEATTPGAEVITSPIVGTFYRSPSPDSPPFCQEGDVVDKGKTICILEAMKVMNELEAEFSMEIVSFRVNNGDMVEYGTPIVEVRRV